MITTIYLDNTQLDSDKRFCSGIKNLAFPDFATSVSRRGSFGGFALTSSPLGSYKFMSEWTIIGDSASDLATERELFAGQLGTILSNGSGVLKITKSNGKSIRLTVSSVSIKGDLSPDSPLASNMLVEFGSEYPLLLNDTESTSDVLIYQGGGMAIPMAIPMAMTSGGGNETSVVNNGNYDSYPTFTFIGPLTNPTLTNTTTDKAISITYTLASTDTIVIDTFNRTALFYTGGIGTGTNVRQYVSGDFWTLLKGNNNVRLGNDSYNAYASCHISYRDSFLGI